MRKLLLPAVLVTLMLGVVLVVVAADAPAKAPTVAAPDGAKPAPKAGPVAPEDMNGVDFTGLSDAQKSLVIDLLNSYTCDCGCSPPMKVAQCRRDDAKCSRSLGMATQVVSLVKAGKSREEIVKAALTVAPPPMVQFDIPAGEAYSQGPKDAKVTILHYFDYQCPFCSKIVPTFDQIRADYPNDVRIVYKMHPLSIHQNAMIAAQASIAAQNQGKFMEMHKKLFEAQRELSREKVIALAKELGLDEAKFTKDLDSAETKARIDKETRESEGIGASGTPASFVNGRYLSGAKPIDAFKTVIDEELKWAKAGNRPKFTIGKNVSEASGKAAAANTGPDPNKKYDLAQVGAPSVGPANAKVTILHAYDYQCPFCVRIHPTMEQLLKDYPKDVRIVYMQHPLPFHQQAGISAEAVMAAKSQGKFQEMHEKLMGMNGQLSRDKIMAAAQEIGLDMKKFTADIDNDAHKAEIAAMTNEFMKIGATGTPASFINGRYLNGAQPLDAFKKIIDEEIGKSTVAGGTK